MTILEALKKIKHLGRKIDKTRERVARWCSYYEDEGEPLYKDISGMLQSINDMLAEQARLRNLIHRTNIATIVAFRGKDYTMDELLLLRTVTIPAQLNALKTMRRKEPRRPSYHGAAEPKQSRVINQYDPKWRDQQIDGLDNTVEEIDNLLDQLNMATSLAE